MNRFFRALFVSAAATAAAGTVMAIVRQKNVRTRGEKNPDRDLIDEVEELDESERAALVAEMESHF